jgi:hypothetical protein
MAALVGCNGSFGLVFQAKRAASSFPSLHSKKERPTLLAELEKRYQHYG